jgi:hypothetical protein
MPDCFWTGFINARETGCGVAPTPCDGVPEFPEGVPLVGVVGDYNFGQGPETAYIWRPGALGGCSGFASLAAAVDAVLFYDTQGPEDYPYVSVHPSTAVAVTKPSQPYPTSVQVIRQCDGYQFAAPVVCAFLQEV